MDVNKEIKELKTEIGDELFGRLWRGKLDRDTAIIGGCALTILEMLDAYTTAYPIVLSPKPKLLKFSDFPQRPKLARIPKKPN